VLVRHVRCSKRWMRAPSLRCTSPIVQTSHNPAWWAVGPVTWTHGLTSVGLAPGPDHVGV
jgi:hypothetical protein